MFAHRIIYGWAPRRKGYCSQCTNNIHDKSSKKTDLHHEFYITCMPWLGAIELCPSCHRRAHKGIKIHKPITYDEQGNLVKHPIVIY